MRVPFAIYADFEALAAKIDTCLPDPTTSSTTNQTKFEACGYAYQVVCTNDNYSNHPSFTEVRKPQNISSMTCSKKKNILKTF